MNMAEALARELVRVTEIREHFREAGRQPNVDVRFALTELDGHIDRACKALGGGDAIETLRVHAMLKDIKA